MYDIDELTISPKPPSSGMTTEHSVLADILENLKGEIGITIFHSK